MKYDQLLVKLGQFGRYQKFQYFLVCLVSITSAFHSMNMVFVGPAPDHHCAPPPPEALPHHMQNLTAYELKNITIPLRIKDGMAQWDTCKIYTDYNSSEDIHVGDVLLNQTSVNQTRPTTDCPYGWRYSKQYYESTIVTQWDLVCEKSWLDEISSTIFFCGRLAGALLCGPLADKFGRRKVFFLSLIAQVVLGCVAAASPSLGFFYCVYFFQGLVQVSVYLTSFVLGMEMVGPKYRKTTGMCMQFFYALGQIILTGMAFGIRRWRYILVSISLPSALFFSYYWLLPESVRWLMVKNKRKEAEQIIRKTARINKIALDNNFMDRLEIEGESTAHKTYTVIDILRSWTMAKIALVVWFTWFVNALVYYGLSLNSSKLHGDPYVNFLLLACVEIPAVAICIPLLDIVGRRYLMLIFMMIGGGGCIATAFTIGRGIMPVVFSTIGKFGITASYAIVYLFAAEVFPTVLRNNGIGMASVCARIGGIIAPLFLNLTSIWQPLPMLLFGVVAVFGGFMCILLPETTGKPLPQSIRDMSDAFSANGVKEVNGEDVNMDADVVKEKLMDSTD